MSRLAEIERAFVKADEAGNTEDAQAFATEIRRLRAAPQEDGNRSAPGTFAQGLNVGVANVAGAPVDLLNAGLGLVGLGSEKPILGSAHLKELIGKIPTGAGPLVYQSLQEVPQEMRPIARGGEAIGGSVPVAAAPFATTRAISELPSLVRPIVQAARSSPGKFATVEAGAAMGAGQGAALAELLAPGNSTAAMTGEMVGGFVNPLGTVAKVVGGAGKSVSTFAKSFTKAGREAKAAETIQKAMVDAGEDPARVAQLLREADLEGVSLTAGQKSESPTLLALEATLSSKNPNFDASMRAKTQDNLKSLRGLVDQLEASGDPRLLREAANLRSRYFDTLLQGRMQAAQAQVERTQGLIRGDRGAASARATQIIDDALADARRIETELWGNVPRGENLSGRSIVESYRNMRSEMLPEEPLPPAFIDNFVARVEQQGTVTSGEALRFRSQMLAKARDARAQKNWSEARIYENMADGALADLAAMEGNQAAQARAFSRSLNDSFSRTFASDAMSVKGSGAERIAPEAVLQRAYGSGGVMANRRFQELEQAAQFSGRSMLHEQEEFLRAAATAAIDPQTGRVNPRSLEGFVRNNADMLNRYPNLRRDLRDASVAEQTFRDVQAAGETASRAMQQRAVFSEVLKNENPAQAVRNVLNSPNPMRGYGQLVKLARRGPEGAMDGLKAATLENAARQATGSTGEFSFAKYQQALTASSGRSPRLLDMMVNNGVMTAPEATRMTLIIRNAERIERGMASKARMGEVISEPDALFDLVVRAVGANVGGNSAMGQAAGAPIVMAGAGSKAARNLFEKVPKTRVMDVVQEAAQNPRFMATLLTKPSTPAASKQIERQINAFLIQAGLVQREQEAQ